MKNLNGLWRVLNVLGVAAALILIVPVAYNFFHVVGNDVRQDVHLLHEQVERLEQAVEGDVKKDLLTLKGQVEKLLTLNSCICDPSKQCNCGENKPTVSQWYQDSQNPNVFYWGYVVQENGVDVLYYTFYQINGQVVKSSIVGGNELKKTTNFVRK
jgi:hypothetical protein